jgi:hypothetical protein
VVKPLARCSSSRPWPLPPSPRWSVNRQRTAACPPAGWHAPGRSEVGNTGIPEIRCTRARAESLDRLPRARVGAPCYRCGEGCLAPSEFSSWGSSSPSTTCPRRRAPGGGSWRHSSRGSARARAPAARPVRKQRTGRWDSGSGSPLFLRHDRAARTLRAGVGRDLARADQEEGASGAGSGREEPEHVRLGCIRKPSDSEFVPHFVHFDWRSGWRNCSPRTTFSGS